MAPFYTLNDNLPPSVSALMDINAPRPFTSSDTTNDETSRKEINDKGYTLVPTQKLQLLTDEEKLLIAEEKRGRRVPDIDKRKLLVQQAHAAGHFGEKAMLSYIDREHYWWPGIRKDISDEIKLCTDCRKYSVIRHGFAPARSIFAARPGDHYQIDLAELPESMEGYKFCLVLVDLFTGFVMLKAIPNKEMTSELHTTNITPTCKYAFSFSPKALTAGDIAAFVLIEI